MTTEIEEQFITKLQTHYATIEGINTAYGYANNPDTITNAVLPAVVFFPQNFAAERKTHRGLFLNTILIKAIVLVVPRTSAGAKLRYVENLVIPFLGRVRRKFQTVSVVDDLLSTAATSAWITRGQYSAGGILSWNSVDFVGCWFDHEFKIHGGY